MLKYQCGCCTAYLPSHNHRTLAEIKQGVVKMGKRNAVSRLLHAKNDKEAIAAWRQDLNRVLHVFNVNTFGRFCFGLANSSSQTKLGINTHVLVTGIHRNMTDQGYANRQHLVSGISTWHPPTTGC